MDRNPAFAGFLLTPTLVVFISTAKGLLASIFPSLDPCSISIPGVMTILKLPPPGTPNPIWIGLHITNPGGICWIAKDGKVSRFSKTSQKESEMGGLQVDCRVQG
jgi:hypothetical protein